jgi:hypothetical protein
MTDFEKLGSFYLGKHHDLETGETEDAQLLYDSKDLCTHAVCVGMTGSGKTGLCVGLLEEAAIDGIPALIIDPKGDLGNLMLTFPDLAPDDFKPWVNADDARRKELSVDEYAAQQAELWRTGLGKWGQDGERIQKLKDSAEVAIYTPGSEAGIPISILSSFTAPPAELLEDGDLMRDRVASTASSLLGLVGVDTDPIQSREHILLSTILDHLWRQGKDVDLGSLIQAVQSPPVERIGVLDIDSFFPSKDRFSFAMKLNNLLAAPGFQGWLKGVPLDIQSLLYTDSGKPRLAIFSIAHLGEAERMFFVSLLLTQTLSWMRSRPGTTSLRALLYMDEIFGYMPPVAEPPSKRPLLTLLKQARAYGLGVVLATQNPVDLDYKGLSNTGTWFIGRLQTERDKLRILEGLEGISTGEGGLDRGTIDKIISGLGKRVFLLHNVHEEEPAIFNTRWVMSYLRGPLTRGQIRDLMADAPREASTGAATASATPARPAAPSAPAVPAPAPAVEVAPPPVLPDDVMQFYLEGGGSTPDYEPCLVGLAEVRFMDKKTKKEAHSEELTLLLPLDERLLKVDWDDAEESDLDERDLGREPTDGASYGALPKKALKSRSYTSWKKALHDHLYRTRSCDLLKSATFKLESAPLESERDFRVRLNELAREHRDGEVEKMRKKHASKVATLEERIRKARQRVEKEKEQAGSEKLKAVISAGASLLSAFTGRKRLSYTTLSKAGTAARGFTRAGEQSQDVDRAEETVEALIETLEELNATFQAEIEAIADRLDATGEELETIALRPRKTDVEVHLVGLAWRPL